MGLGIDSIRDFLIEVDSFLVVYFVVSVIFTAPAFSSSWRENLVPVLMFSVLMIFFSYLISLFVKDLMKRNYLLHQIIGYFALCLLLIFLITNNLIFGLH